MKNHSKYIQWAIKIAVFLLVVSAVWYLISPKTDNIGKQLNYSKQLQNPQNIATSPINCEATIDTTGITQTASHTNAFEVVGWMVADVEKGITPDEDYVTLTDANGKTTYFIAQQISRPDVNSHFNQPTMKNAGFAAYIDISDFTGDYKVGLAYKINDEIQNCEQFNLPLSIYKPEALQQPQNVSSTTVSCKAAVDLVNGVAPNGAANIPVENTLTIYGWMVLDEKKGTIPDAVFATITDISGQTFYAKLSHKIPRPDVKDYFNQPNMPDPGFETQIDISSLSGKYALGLARLEQGVIYKCADFNNIPLSIASTK